MQILIPPDPPPPTPSHRLTLLSPGFTQQKWIGLCRLVFSTLHSLFTVMLLWFCNGLRANESPAAGSVLFSMCARAAVVFVCRRAWASACIFACLRVFVLTSYFNVLLDLAPTRWVSLSLNSKVQRVAPPLLLSRKLPYHREIDCLVSFQGW